MKESELLRSKLAILEEQIEEIKDTHLKTEDDKYNITSYETNITMLLLRVIKELERNEK